MTVVGVVEMTVVGVAERTMQGIFWDHLMYHLSNKLTVISSATRNLSSANRFLPSVEMTVVGVVEMTVVGVVEMTVVGVAEMT